MQVKSIAPWFGGKRTMAPAIVRELGDHQQYFEPFCGSMAVLFAKEVSRCETVNDLHGDLINLARVLQRIELAEQLYERLQRVVFAEPILKEAVTILENTPVPMTQGEPDIDRAYRYFLASWMARNGVAGTARMEYQIAVRWTKNGGSPTVRFRGAVESIPDWHKRLKNVVILNRDAFRILDRFEDAPHTAIYVDPPYVAKSRSGYGNQGQGSKYLHEFDHNGGMFGDDHSAVADVLRSYKHARIVVSYYDCDRVRELYRGWTFVDHTRLKNLHVQNGDGQTKNAPEVLIINGKSYAGAS